MAAILWTDVTALAPELATVGVPAQTIILEHVNSALAVDLWGGEEAVRLKMARSYLAAHFGAQVGAGGAAAAGPVVAESADGLSRSYANLFAMMGSDPLYDATSYGRQYRLLVHTNPRLRGPFVF